MGIALSCRTVSCRLFASLFAVFGSRPAQAVSRAAVASWIYWTPAAIIVENSKRTFPMSAPYARHGNVAVITLDNPPVNGLGHALRMHIVDGINAAQSDDAVNAIVLIGAGKAFSGGADIKEFNTPKALAEPALGTVIRAVETSAKPVIAAIHAVA